MSRLLMIRKVMLGLVVFVLVVSVIPAPATLAAPAQTSSWQGSQLPCWIRAKFLGLSLIAVMPSAVTGVTAAQLHMGATEFTVVINAETASTIADILHITIPKGTSNIDAVAKALIGKYNLGPEKITLGAQSYDLKFDLGSFDLCPPPPSGSRETVKFPVQLYRKTKAVSPNPVRIPGEDMPLPVSGNQLLLISVLVAFLLTGVSGIGWVRRQRQVRN